MNVMEGSSTCLRRVLLCLGIVFGSPGLLIAGGDFRPDGQGKTSSPPIPLNAASLTIEGVPERFATPSPPYGTKNGLLPGAVSKCSIKPLEGTTREGTVAYTFTGWKVYDTAGAQKTLLDQGTTSEVAVEQRDTQMLLEWIFDRKLMIEFIVVGDGTITEESGWRADGETITVTANPAPGVTFSHWEGEIGDADPHLPTLTFTATKPGAVTAYFAKTFHVSNGGDDAADGLSWETAVKTIAKGLELARPGDTVLLADGTFDITSQLQIRDKMVILRSLNGRDKTTIRGNHEFRLLQIDNASSIVEGITFANGWGGIGIGPEGGMVRDCRVKDCTSTVMNFLAGWYGPNSPSILQEGGLVTCCVVENNKNVTSEPSGTVRLKGGIFENSVIVNNADKDKGAGLYIEGGVARHCTISRNQGSDVGCGVYLGKSGRLENSIVWGNIHRDSPLDPEREISGMTTTNVVNCWYEDPLGTNTVMTSPLFVDADHGDFRLRGGSPCIDAGLDSDDLPETDFDGMARKLGKAVDIGAFEYDPGVFSCGIRPSVGLGAAPLQTVLLPVVYGATSAGSELQLAWTIDSGDGNLRKETSTGLGGLSLSLETGAYDVTLEVTDPALGKTARVTFPDCVIASPKTIYVAQGNQTPAPPYASWETASKDINAAFDLAVAGTTVLVSNGLYEISKPFVLNDAITLESVNGYEETVLRPPQTTWQWDGVGPVRENGVPGIRLCVLNHPDACVRGITLSGSYSDAGVHGPIRITEKGGLLEKCRVTGNFAKSYDSGGAGVCLLGGRVNRCLIDRNEISLDGMKGGGVFLRGGIVENSLIIENKSYTLGQCLGAGVFMSGGILRNCTIVKNSCNRGAGVSVEGNRSRVYNCIIVDNVARSANQDISGAPECFMNNCSGKDVGADCIVADPAFVNAEAWDFTLAASSPCVDSGFDDPDCPETDYLGNPRKMGPGLDIGAVEYDQRQPSCGITPLPGKALAPAKITLSASSRAFDNDFSSLNYTWTFDAEAADSPVESGVGLTGVTHVYEKPGRYNVRLEVSDPAGNQSAVTVLTNAVLAVPHEVFVVAGNAQSAPPHDRWENACADIMEGLSWTAPGSTLTVGDGVYGLDKVIRLEYPIHFRSRNGFETTTLRGKKVQGIRVIDILHPEAIVEGFTISGGCTAWIGSGGGVHLKGGTLKRCRVTDNWVGDWSTGAGVDMQDGLISGCIISNNAAGYRESGFFLDCGGLVISGGICENSIITDSAALNYGGVLVHGGILRNCTITGNREDNPDGRGAGGLHMNGGVIENCIIWGNEAASSKTACAAPNCTWNGDVRARARNNCTSAAFGTNSVVADPLFRDAAAGDYRIGAASPCHDKGLYGDWMDDALDFWGNTRHDTYRKVDIGAYEDYSSRTTILILR